MSPWEGKTWLSSGLDMFLYLTFPSRSGFAQVPSYQKLGFNLVQIGKSSLVQISHDSYIFSPASDYFRKKHTMVFLTSEIKAHSVCGVVAWASWDCFHNFKRDTRGGSL